jgi:hypothetical protein
MEQGDELSINKGGKVTKTELRGEATSQPEEMN